MKFLKPIITLLGFSLILSGCTIPFFGSKKAALQVTSVPRATVFLDGKHVGQTPYFDENLKTGEYSLKLVPEETTDLLPSWETKIKLNPQILTVVNRAIAATDSDSSGEILTLEPLSSKTKNILAIISIPDNAIVKLDSQPKGFTPVSLDDVGAGEHTITLSAPGFKEKIIKAKVTNGHKLTISAQLAKSKIVTDEPDDTEDKDDEVDEDEDEEVQASPSPSPSSDDDDEDEEDSTTPASAKATKKPYVEILDNPAGFLRIRKEPTTSSPQVAQATPGQKLPYQDESQAGWYKVRYATEKYGWVSRGASGEYAKLVE